MPRRRNAENRGLPPRSRWMHGAIYYRVPPGRETEWDGKKQFRLGATVREAFESYAKRIKREETEIVYINQLLDKYAVEVIPEARSARTRLNKLAVIPRLKKHFGQMRLADFEPQHCYQYVTKRKNARTGAPAITAAHRELEVISHAFTYAVMWGHLSKHPIEEELRFEGKLSPQPRERYVENWEISEALSLKPLRKSGSVLMCRAYIRLKLHTGLRMQDLLSLKPSDADEIGINVTASKTRNSTRIKQIFTWLDEQGRDTGLKAAWQAALNARPVDIAPWVFCTSKGQSYIDTDGRTDSFQSVWQRFMDRVMTETKLKERFAERDIRAKVGSDFEEIEKAQLLLGHADSRVTKKHYRRKPQVVRPAKSEV